MSHRSRFAQVLLVDDDDQLLASLAIRLRGQFRVHTANDGVAALRLLREHDIDVVVVDQRMPGQSGIDLLLQVRAEFPGTARVMLTGDDSSDTARAAINDGAVTRLLTKPCQAIDLVAAIDTALAQSATQRVANQAVETAVMQRTQSNLLLALGLQLGAPMAEIREAAAALLTRAGDDAQLAALARRFDRLLRRYGVMFDRFQALLGCLGDGGSCATKDAERAAAAEA